MTDATPILDARGTSPAVSRVVHLTTRVPAADLFKVLGRNVNDSRPGCRAAPRWRLRAESCIRISCRTSPHYYQAPHTTSPKLSASFLLAFSNVNSSIHMNRRQGLPTRRTSSKTNPPSNVRPVSFDLRKMSVQSKFGMYGGLSWFRLALRWRPPSKEKLPRQPTLRSVIRSRNVPEQMQDMLPLDFLASGSMCGIAYSKALLFLSEVAYASVVRYISEVWAVWLDYRDSSRLVASHVAASKIQSFTRRWIALGIHGAMVTECVKTISNNKTRQLDLIVRLRGRARQILTFVGHCGILLRAEARNLREAAATVLQAALHAHIKSLRDTAGMIVFLKSRCASIEIQRTFRGAVARTLSRQSRCRFHHSAMHTRYHSTESSTNFSFEQQGAAHKLQLWIKSLPLCIITSQHSISWQSASKIQNALRRWHLKKGIHARVRARRRLRVKAMIRTRAAATLIARTYRGRVARLRVFGMYKSAALAQVPANQECTNLDGAMRQMTRTNPRAKKTIKRGIVSIQSLQRGRLASAKVNRIRVRNVFYGARTMKLFNGWNSLTRICLTGCWCATTCAMLDGASIETKTVPPCDFDAFLDNLTIDNQLEIVHN